MTEEGLSSLAVIKIHCDMIDLYFDKLVVEFADIPKWPYLVFFPINFCSCNYVSITAFVLTIIAIENGRG